MPRPVSFDQAVLKSPHRFTLEHIPAWADLQREDGMYYAPQYSSDREWYERTLFGTERLTDPRTRYMTDFSATWPLGQSLSSPIGLRIAA